MADKTAQCVKNYCGKVFLKRTRKISKKMEKIFVKLIKPKDKNPTRKEKNKYEKLKKKMKKIFKITKKKEREYIENCKKGYCNPGCKDTFFEQGSKTPEGAFDEAKKQGIYNKMFIKTIKKMRKEIFGKKKNVLKNDMYEKLSKKDVKTLRKQGAISGCTLFVL